MPIDEAASDRATHGWESDLPTFTTTAARVIRTHLEGSVEDPSIEQISAWDDSIPGLQREVRELLARDRAASGYSTILEYELPLQARRHDVIFLVGATVVVVELKGKEAPSRADLDQVTGYVRDLRSYHAECHGRHVVGVLVPTHAVGFLGERSGVIVCGPDSLDGVLAEISVQPGEPGLTRAAFLASDAYSPLPSLVEAARELFRTGSLRRIRRAKASTDPAMAALTQIVHAAAVQRSRKLVLLTGHPGTGKTLVGLRLVHANYLADLAEPRPAGKTAAPAVFLSGNQPLVEVLQYELRDAGGDGRVFVRQVKDYVRYFSSRKRSRPPEHVMVFDEAQRAFDAGQVAAKHRKTPGYGGGKGEPQLFVEFAERVPSWCVVLALVGTGQEIHIGEEGGLEQWRDAIEETGPDQWEVVGPPNIASAFRGSRVRFSTRPELHLVEELRYHWTNRLHEFVDGLLSVRCTPELNEISRSLRESGFHLRITRDLERAKTYLRDRYSGDKDARFGLLASSRDKDLAQCGVDNSFNTTRRVRFGPWYADGEEKASSCRRLQDCVTEFGAQGLELDATLLAWGTDFQWTSESWSSAKTRKYKEQRRVRDLHQLRTNAYRVLLTRARETIVVFVPRLQELDPTDKRLRECGFVDLEDVE